MLTAFLGVVDRLIKLLERRELRQARLFEKLVDPLFRDLEPVAVDYVRFFDDCAKELFEAERQANPQAAMRAAAKRVRARRNEFLLARKKTQALARLALAEVTDEDVRTFAVHVATFFFGSNLHYGTSEAAKVADLFDAFAAWRMWWLVPADNPVAGGKIPSPAALAMMVDRTRSNLERIWNDIVESHASLRLKLLNL